MFPWVFDFPVGSPEEELLKVMEDLEKALVDFDVKEKDNGARVKLKLNKQKVFAREKKEQKVKDILSEIFKRKNKKVDVEVEWVDG